MSKKKTLAKLQKRADQLDAEVFIRETVSMVQYGLIRKEGKVIRNSVKEINQFMVQEIEKEKKEQARRDELADTKIREVVALTEYELHGDGECLLAKIREVVNSPLMVSSYNDDFDIPF